MKPVYLRTAISVIAVLLTITIGSASAADHHHHHDLDSSFLLRGSPPVGIKKRRRRRRAQKKQQGRIRTRNIPTKTRQAGRESARCNILSVPVESTYILSFTEDTSTLTNEELADAFNMGYDAMIFLVVGCTPQIQNIHLPQRDPKNVVFHIQSRQLSGTSLLVLPWDEPLFLWGFNAALDSSAHAVAILQVVTPSPTFSPTSPPMPAPHQAIVMPSPITLPHDNNNNNPTSIAQANECNFVTLQTSYIVSFNGDPSGFGDEELALAFNLGYDAMIFLSVRCTPQIQSIHLPQRSTTTTTNSLLPNMETIALQQRATNKTTTSSTTNSLLFEVRARLVSGTSLLVLPNDEPLFLWGFNSALEGDNKVTAIAIDKVTGPTNPPTPEPTNSPTPGVLLSFGPLNYVGNEHDGYFYSLYPMRVCEGDCDSDSDCQAGLYCYQRAKLQPVPYCSGGETLDSSMDFCVWDTSFPPPRVPTPPMGVFRIKLYWDPTYRWQNETFDRRWCMIHDFDGYPGNGECHYGDYVRDCLTTQLYIGYCLEGDPRQWFTVTDLGTTYSGDHHREWLIRTVSDPRDTTSVPPERCLTRRESQIYLTENCNPDDKRQRFFALNGKIDPLDSQSRFELGQYEGYTHDNCVANAHHPKSGEVIEFHICEHARAAEDQTSYWQLIL